MATDNFYGIRGIALPAHGASPVTRSDTVDLPQVSNSLWIGAGGSMKVNMADGGSVQFMGIPSGTKLEIRAARVWATGTGASDIINLY